MKLNNITQGHEMPLLSIQQSQYNSISLQKTKASQHKRLYFDDILELPKDIRIILYSNIFEICDEKLAQKLMEYPVLFCVRFKLFCEIQEKVR
jgi:hypothetical protein